MSKHQRITNLALVITVGAFQHLIAAESENSDAAATYQLVCYACHGTGQAHAPIVGEAIEWEIRLEKGMDTLVKNTIEGLNGVMPARGFCAVCSDENLKAIVEYMIEQSQ